MRHATPVANDRKQIAVSRELAATIRAMDAALVAEFGLDLCYVVMARGTLVAASNARDGFVTPKVAPTAASSGS